MTGKLKSSYSVFEENKIKLSRERGSLSNELGFFQTAPATTRRHSELPNKAPRPICYRSTPPTQANNTSDNVLPPLVFVVARCTAAVEAAACDTFLAKKITPKMSHS